MHLSEVLSLSYVVLFLSASLRYDLLFLLCRVAPRFKKHSTFFKNCVKSTRGQ